MASCSGSGQFPGPLTLHDLSDLKVGEVRAGTGCVPSIQGTQGGSAFATAFAKGFSIPNNGEFEWGGLGPGCNMDAFNYGCEKKDSWMGGSKPTVVRTRYNGGAVECCLADGAAIVTDRTCDPQYKNPNGNACIQSMMNYCSTGSAIYNIAKCRDWANAQPAAAKELQLRYAKLNPGDPNSLSFCKNLAAKGDSSCDDIYINFCRANPNHAACSCINSVVAKAGLNVNPSCIDNVCFTGSGYQTLNMLSKPCPNVVSCDMKVTLNQNGYSLNTNVPISQNCGNNNGPTAPAATPGTYNGAQGSVSVQTPVLQTKTSNNTIIWIFIALIVLVIFGGGMLYYFLADDFTPYTDFDY